MNIYPNTYECQIDVTALENLFLLTTYLAYYNIKP